MLTQDEMDALGAALAHGRVLVDSDEIDKATDWATNILADVATLRLVLEGYVSLQWNSEAGEFQFSSIKPYRAEALR